MKTLILNSKNNEEKQLAKDLIKKHVNNLGVENIKAYCKYSNKKNFKGIEIYEIGHKALIAYIDILNKNVTTYSKRKPIAQWDI